MQRSRGYSLRVSFHSTNTRCRSAFVSNGPSFLRSLLGLAGGWDAGTCVLFPGTAAFFVEMMTCRCAPKLFEAKESFAPMQKPILRAEVFHGEKPEPHLAAMCLF